MADRAREVAARQASGDSQGNRHTHSAMRACIEECLRCYSVCLSTAMNHCLEMGGEHMEKKHFALIMACADAGHRPTSCCLAPSTTSTPAPSARKSGRSAQRTATALAICRGLQGLCGALRKKNGGLIR